MTKSKTVDMPERRINTVFGEMKVEKDMVVSVSDNQFWYTLPYEDMTNDEIKDYLRILYEEQEENE